jgi:uncharacterized membrane protein
MTPLTMMHLAVGSAALATGAIAFSVAKGSRLHVLFGIVFAVSMILLAGTGVIIAVLKTKPLPAFNGIFTIYLIGTAWATARQQKRDRWSLHSVSAIVAIGCGLGLFSYGAMALKLGSSLHGFPAPAYFVFGTVAFLAAALDFSYFRRAQVSGRQRILRHVWRMSVGLFIATGSFFLGQQQVLPAAVRGSPILVGLALLPLILMIYWQWRLRQRSSGKRQRSAPLSQSLQVPRLPG